MSLEQAILDRLEKRNAQIAQLQSTVHALERAADSQREHGMMERGRLLEENQKLADRIERMEESAASADMLRKSLNAEITKRDHELREHEKELAQAREEIRALRALRAEAPLESTREALKNAIAKLQGVTTDRDRLRNELAAIYAEANKSGYCNGDPVAQIKKGQHDADKAVSISAQLQEVTTRADNIAICRDRWMKIAADCGRMDGEDVGEFIARLAHQAALGGELAGCYEDLRVRNVKQEQELDELRALAKAGMEGSEGVAEFITRLQRMAADRKTALDRAAETIAKMGTGEVVKHPVIDWYFVAVSLQNEIARLNAKVGPLEKLYQALKKHVDNGAILNRGDLNDAYAEIDKSLSQLTA